MQLAYMRELYRAGLCQVREGFADWQEAIHASIRPMVDQGMVEAGYGDAIIRHVEEFGPYIFLAPHICMPHCKAYQYVKRPGVCFMKSNQTVRAEGDDPFLYAELFFAIAAENEGDHLDAIGALMEVLDDEEAVQALLAVQTEADLERLLG